MEYSASRFLYESNIFIQWVLPLLLVILVGFPRYMVVFVTMLILLRPNERFDTSVSFPTLMFPALFLCLLIYFIRSKELNIEKDDKVIALLMVLIMMETIAFHREDVKNNLMGAGLGLIHYFSLRFILSDSKGCSLLNLILILSCLLICFEPLYYHFTGLEGTYVWQSFHAPDGRLEAWGMWKNANETAFIASFGVANIMVHSLRTKNRGVSLLFWSPAVILFVLVALLAASRSGMASLAIVFLVLLFLSKSWALRFSIMILMLFAVLLGPDYLTKRTDMEGSSSQRFDLRYQGRQLIKEHPMLGVGFGRSRYEAGGMALHSTYIQVFAETGILGGLLLIYFLYLIGRKAFLSLLLSRKTGEMSMYHAAVVGMYVSGLFYFYFGNQLLTPLFYVLMGTVRSGSLIQKVKPQGIDTAAMPHC